MSDTSNVDQITTVVAGFDDRMEYSKLKNKYFIGQFYTSPEGQVNYDLYYLFTGADIDYAASELDNPCWNDITFNDVRIADTIYETCTTKQKWNIDWVRGLAIQLGYVNFFCVDEPDWLCAYVSPSTGDFEGWDNGIIYEVDPPEGRVNTYYPAFLKDVPPYLGQSQKASSVLLK